jgi:formyl-CoA transferase
MRRSGAAVRLLLAINRCFSVAANAPPKPLSGVRVLELGQLIAGPFCARVLSDFGATVLKVEPPGAGDPLRKWRVLDPSGLSYWWRAQSRGKRSFACDLRTEGGRADVAALSRGADVLIENFKPGTMEGWGLSPASLRAENPRLIVLRVSGFGQTGPYSGRPGFAATAEAMGGLRHLMGEPGRLPVRAGVSLGDTLAGLHGVMGVLLALRARDATGKGQDVDVALYESVFNVMESLVPEFSGAGVVRQPAGAALPGIAPSNAYRCACGGAVVVGGNGDSVFRRLMTVVGAPLLRDDPTLAANDGRVRRVAEIDAAIGAWAAARSVEEAEGALLAAGVPASRIFTAADIARDEHYKARGMLVKGEDGVVVPGVVPKLADTPGGWERNAPALGEANGALEGALRAGRCGWAALGQGEKD